MSQIELTESERTCSAAFEANILKCPASGSHFHRPGGSSASTPKYVRCS
jgi:hypothetical protein